MNSIVRYTLITALRDWLFLGILGLIFCVSALSVVLGGTSLVEQHFAIIAFVGGVSRITIVVGMILFICFHVRRSYDNKEIELILSRPISRFSFLLCYYAGFMLLALIILVPFCFLLGVCGVRESFLDNLHVTFLWMCSFYVELAVVIAFSLLCALIVKSAVISALSCMAFYFLCRILGFFLMAVTSNVSLIQHDMLGKIACKTFLLLNYIIPRFDMSSKAEWLVHGFPEAHIVAPFIIGSCVYVCLLLSMAYIDFNKKEF